jgi:hypothetical protein
MITKNYYLERLYLMKNIMKLKEHLVLFLIMIILIIVLYVRYEIF